MCQERGKRHLLRQDREVSNPTHGNDLLGAEGCSSLGKQSIPGMFFLYIFVGMGGGRADGRCLWKLFIFNPVESCFWFLAFKIKNGPCF